MTKDINRRTFVAFSGAALLSAQALGGNEESALEINARIAAHRPSRGGPIPVDIASRLGATHYSGRYHLTEEPFLIEGAKALAKMGFGVAKFWLDRRLPGYSFNSDWKLAKNATLADVARHPYFVEAFAQPFGCIALEIQPVGNYGGSWRRKAARFDEDREQMYELAAYLLSTYRDREVRFILQHWEGDWMLRDFPGQMWDKERPGNVGERCDAMARWLKARQEGVERARREAGKTRCRVEHATEVNRVLDTLKGIPTLCSEVLPRVELDWVSCSCYDGMGSGVDLWRGIETIRRFAGAKTGVYIGEIGVPENQRTREEAIELWDRAMGVFLAMDIPYVIHWELYCNEWKEKPVVGRPARGEDMRGFWLIRPDGSVSWSGEYLTRMLKR